MANSKTYVNQSEQLNNNLQKWGNFVSTITEIINQYQSTIDSLSEQIEDNKSSIAGLKTYINELESKIAANPSTYIKLESNTLEVQNTTGVNKEIDTYFNVFSNASKVYVSASKTVAGLTLNDIDVTSGNPFYTFTGSICGDKLNFKASNVNKTDNATIIFSSDPTDSDTYVNLEINIKPAKYTVASINKPINIEEIAGKFQKAASDLNGTLINTTISDRLNATASTTLDQQLALSDLTQQLLGSSGNAGVIVKKSNALNNTSKSLTSANSNSTTKR